MVGKILEGSPLPDLNLGFLHCWFSPSAVHARRGGGRQAHSGIGLLDDLCEQIIAADKSARRVQEHQTCCAIGKFKGSKRLQGKLEAALRKSRSSEPLRELQAQKAVASYPL